MRSFVPSRSHSGVSWGVDDLVNVKTGTALPKNAREKGWAELVGPYSNECLRRWLQHPEGYFELGLVLHAPSI